MNGWRLGSAEGSLFLAMSSPLEQPKPADPDDESVDLGEESDDYDGEFDVGLAILFVRNYH